jgi:hypothetical protein
MLNRPRKRRSWSLREKQEALRLCEEKGVKETMATFGVSEGTLYGWKRKRDPIQDVEQPSTRKRLEGGGRKLTLPTLESSAVEFVRSCRDRGQAVNGPLLQAHVESVARANRLVEFKASSGWCSKFKERNHLVSRRVTGFVQKMPIPRELGVREFRDALRQLKLEHQLADNVRIWNFDETPLYFDMPLATTLDQMGKKQVLVRKALSSRKRFTVALTISSHGDKLMPFIIFPGKRPIKPSTAFTNVIVCVQPKGFMDGIRFQDWVSRVMTVGRSASSPTEILVLDSFSAHANPTAVQKLKDVNLILLQVPGGCTPFIQPLDVAVNKPFKNRVRDSYRRWMANDAIHTFSKNGTMQAASREEVVQWVQTAWTQISSDLVQNSFTAAGLTPSTLGETELCDDAFLEQLRQRWQGKLPADSSSS